MSEPTHASNDACNRQVFWDSDAHLERCAACWQRLQQKLRAMFDLQQTFGFVIGFRVHAHICQRCGTQFFSRTSRTKLCRFPCVLAARRERQQAARRKNREPSPLACSLCRRLFTPRRSTRRYCSSACRQTAYRRRKAALRQLRPVPVTVSEKHRNARIEEVAPT